MNNYKGTIIEESLEDVFVLKDVKITSTDVENVVAEHKTPWLSRWTLHKVEADFKNGTNHYIIFRDKVFFIDRTSKEQYDEAKKYGILLGIPEYQVDFHSKMKKWEGKSNRRLN